MKISSISLISANQRYKCAKGVDYNNALKNTTNNKQCNPSFKGEMGQAAGAALGMFAGVVATFVTGPLAALAISTGGLILGGFAGDKIEDGVNKKGDK